MHRRPGLGGGQRRQEKDDRLQEGTARTPTGRGTISGNMASTRINVWTKEFLGGIFSAYCCYSHPFFTLSFPSSNILLTLPNLRMRAYNHHSVYPAPASLAHVPDANPQHPHHKVVIITNPAPPAPSVWPAPLCWYSPTSKTWPEL